jgi:hypothetical protein
VVVGVLLLISEHNGQTTSESSSTGTSASRPCMVKIMTDNAPMRSGPDLNDSILHTLPAGAVIQADRITRNGFRQIVPNRWVAQQYLDPVPGSDCG